MKNFDIEENLKLVVVNSNRAILHVTKYSQNEIFSGKDKELF